VVRTKNAGSSRICRVTLFAILASSLVFLALADPPPSVESPPPTLHAETRVVQIEVVVTDPRGKPAAGLKKEDFSLSDDGKPRKIDIFTVNGGESDGSSGVQTESPSGQPSKPLPSNVFTNRNPGLPDLPGHSTVILIDEANAWFENVAWAGQGVVGLMNKVKPDEKIAVYVIARKLGLVLLQDYTTDRESLLKNLGRYVPRGTSPCMVAPGAPCHSGQDKGMQEDRDAAAIAREKEFMVREDSENARLSLQTLADQLALVPGRKSVFWLTQGFPPKLMREPAWDKTITALNEANVAVNTVDTNEQSGFLRLEGSGGILTMERVAVQTGGNAYSGRNDIDFAMAEGIDASRASYTLAFYLAGEDRNNKFHNLKVIVGHPGLRLYYRQGYYAGDDELPAHDRAKGYLEANLLNQANSTGVGITAHVDKTHGALSIRLNLDAAKLSLREVPGGWTGKVEEVFVERNDSGDTLAKVSDTKEFEVTHADRARYDANGVSWTQTFPLTQGAVTIAVVVRDSATGRVGSLTIPLN